MRDGHRPCVGNCICQLYILGIGNSFAYEILMTNGVTKSDNKIWNNLLKLMVEANGPALFSVLLDKELFFLI